MCCYVENPKLSGAVLQQWAVQRERACSPSPIFSFSEQRRVESQANSGQTGSTPASFNPTHSTSHTRTYAHKVARSKPALLRHEVKCAVVMEVAGRKHLAGDKIDKEDIHDPTCERFVDWELLVLHHEGRHLKITSSGMVTELSCPLNLGLITFKDRLHVCTSY